MKAELALSPEGNLFVLEGDRAQESLETREYERIRDLFNHGSYFGLLHLGVQDFEESLLPPSFLFWKSFSCIFITRLCKQSSLDDMPDFQECIDAAPCMQGLEYLTTDVLQSLWKGMRDVLFEELHPFSGDIQAYLQQFNTKWNMVGRICFHLAENKNDEDHPFAFLATYTTGLSQKNGAQHLPLKRALQEYAGENNREGLLSLLLPVQRAAKESSFIKNLVDSGAIFQPQAFSVRDAHQFLKEIPLFEKSGVMVRVPNWWNIKKPPRPKVEVTIGDTQGAMFGLDTLLDFRMSVALGGEEISHEEWDSLLQSGESLVKIKGQWVEIEKEKLQMVLSEWKRIQNMSKNGMSMAEAVQLLSGMYSKNREENSSLEEWSTVRAGEWLESVLQKLRSPRQKDDIGPVLEKYLQGTLRPYQVEGVSWLYLLYTFKLGGCLADDMGLGKTIQVLSLFLIIKHHVRSSKKPHLLVVPASLLSNWQMECARFAPTIKLHVAHGSFSKEEMGDVDCVMTTYGFLQRSTWIKEQQWDLLVLDEAQAIKNPDTKQTRAVKGLKSQVRLTLTGTPVENRLGDLWSLFDFMSPGLLGSAKDFSQYIKKAEEYSSFIKTVRTLTQPYILRRLKNDKAVISDLPDKTEIKAFCSLTKNQVFHYQQAIEELALKLETAEKIARRGLVLAYLLRLKQICNHPCQWLGFGEFKSEDSGKFVRLQEICEEIAAKQEKVLVFTQFREIIPAIFSHLTKVFGGEGLMLHGETPIKKRQEYVSLFQQGQAFPFFVLSLKAGGTGLNLTRASHVVHFDRWWNPAVENQATDRAYRIGQKHPVLVHKFVTMGTIEEKIDEMIYSKSKLSQDILGGEEDISITELSNEELLRVVSLDLKKALGE